ncbi:integrase family protein [Paludibacter propionicigenes WB4]|uniref:Integrase family protein n=1 Tax=Paludibacter propionicigenes (strain DSM 17365 / JCM 13257 / WB4) TaxID=694427 RepID=E4T0L4_PALPW|nr:phage integrase SAM-like domain-containing protein [Paludibacter propionicigenes]ADQ81078.1 integrase family protein [Paludibacter propionicigenes WB4]
MKYNVINDRLQAINVELSNLLQSAKEVPDKQLIIEKLNDVCNKVESVKELVVETFWETTDRFVEATNVTPSSRKQLKSALKRFKTFEGTLSYSLTFGNINGETLTAFEQWLKDGTRGRNSITSILKRIQRFFSWAIKDQKLNQVEVTITNPFTDFTITPEMYGTPVVLEKAERDYLFDLPLVNERMKKIRDIFIFQCYCGARISDLMKLTTANLHGDILKYVPQKTAKESIKEVVIPLNKNAIHILKRYNDPEGYLLPRMSDTEINRTLKTLFKTVSKERPKGLDRPVGHLNPKTEIIEYIPLHELASTHLARRTFAGLMYAAGQKDDLIASMTGHSENSKAFTRYRAIDMDLKKKATKNQ